MWRNSNPVSSMDMNRPVPEAMAEPESRAEPIRVLQILGSLGMGGAETWMMQLLRRWRQTGAVHCDFLLTSAKPGVFDDEARALGVELHKVSFTRHALANFGGAYREILRRGRYDAIHDHCDYASGLHFAFGIGQLPKVRIAHIHNPWVHISELYGVTPTRRLAVRAGKWLIERLATHVCGTSTDILVRYGFQPGANTTPQVGVAHCGFEIDDFSRAGEPDRESVRQEFGWPTDSKLVLCVGRLDLGMSFDHPLNHKNTWFAMNVAAAAIRSDPALRLIVVGAGDERRERLENVVSGWGLSENIRLVGVRRDVARLMRAADVLLFPSRQEGLGMAAVEAQAAGLPVLASTAVPLEAHVVPEIYHALSLEEPVEAWARALADIASAPRPSLAHCRDLMARSAFSIEASARKLEQIYAAGRACP
jgi:glycosyltransferase involved in cell wall biosynthesis